MTTALHTLPSGASDVGKRFPSEKKLYVDEITGVPVTVLTSSPANDARIYQTHPQWTADGKWVVFQTRDRSADGNAQAFAVNETSGEIVQLTDGPGLNPKSLTLSEKRNVLYFLRSARTGDPEATEIVELLLDPLFADSAAGTLKEGAYERVVVPLSGTIGEMDLDADEKLLYFRAALPETERSRELTERFGPCRVAPYIPHAIRSVDIATGEVKDILTTDFTVGHLQTNPVRSGEFTYCHETGGDAPQRIWIRHPGRSEGRPLFVEGPTDWVTHEAFAGEDEVVFNLIGHMPELRKNPTGIAIINVRTDEVRLLGQPTPNPPIEDERGFWHCNVSPNGRWAVGDTFSGNVYLIDRTNNAMTLLTTGHRMEPDHAHPSFSADSRRVLIQSGHLSNGKHLDLMMIEVPDFLLGKPRDLPPPRD